MTEGSWDENAFANASPDLRFGMLFTSSRELRARLKTVDENILGLGAKIDSNKHEILSEVKSAISAQTEILKPMQTRQEVKEAFEAKGAADAKHQRDVLMVVFAGVPAAAILIGGCVTIGSYFIKTDVHVAVPTVEVSPKTAPFITGKP